MMYCEWASLQTEVQSDGKSASVLHKFPDAVGKDVAATVVKNLAPTLSVGVQSGEPSNLKADKEVKWTMEVSANEGVYRNNNKFGVTTCITPFVMLHVTSTISYSVLCIVYLIFDVIYVIFCVRDVMKL